MMRLLAIALTLLMASAGLEDATAATGFPQAKINHIDVSEAPKIKVYFSLLGSSLKPATLAQVNKVKIYHKDKGESAEFLMGVADDEPIFPDDMDDSEKADKSENPPELAAAIDQEEGAAVVVVVPGHGGEEYKGELGNRNRNGAAMFFKKMGKTHNMNVVFYNDFVWSFVKAQNRENELAKYDLYKEKCEKWADLQLPMYGEPPAEDAASDPDEVLCGLTSEYSSLGDFVKKKVHEGFWPQLFRLNPVLCGQPENDPKFMSIKVPKSERDREKNPYADHDGSSAFDVALKMLVKEGKPHQPKIMILTGDGADGYVLADEDCDIVFRKECESGGGSIGGGEEGEPKLTRKERRARRTGLASCMKAKRQQRINKKQAEFASRLNSWISLAKTANVRIYSVVHPNATPEQSTRLQLLAWRTGGTARVADDPNEVVDHYDTLIEELNSQFVVTFNDEDAVGGAPRTYIVQAFAPQDDYKTEPYEVFIPAVKVKSTVDELRELGTEKLGPAGFMAAAAGVGLILLLILFKLGKKVFGGGGAKALKKAKAGAKGAKGAKDMKGMSKHAKKAAKAKDKAKKAAIKKKAALVKAKAKAKAKAKKG